MSHAERTKVFQYILPQLNSNATKGHGCT